MTYPGYIAEISQPVTAAATDTITDFTPGEDRMDLTAFDFEDLDALDDVTHSDGDDVVIDLTGRGGPEVILENQNLFDLGPDDFIL